MPSKREVYFISVLILIIFASYLAYIWAPVEQLLGESYRILYLHVPIAWVGYLSFGISVVSGIIFLVKRRYSFDLASEVGAALGLVYGAVTLITGAIWANVAWGTYWNWDPRQTATLVMWIAYMGYMSLRASLENVERRASLSATYNILAFSTIPLSYISAVYWQSLHPRIITTAGVTISTNMVTTLALDVIASTLLYIYIFDLFYRTRSLEQKVQKYLVRWEVKA